MIWILAIVLVGLLLPGCSDIQKPSAVPTFIAQPAIQIPKFGQITEDLTDCKEYKCETVQGKAILVVTENRVNKTTYKNRNIGIELPECQIKEVVYDNINMQEERRVVAANDYSNFFILHYFIPLAKGSYSVRIRNSCQFRGNTYTINAN